MDQPWVSGFFALWAQLTLSRPCASLLFNLDAPLFPAALFHPMLLRPASARDLAIAVKQAHDQGQPLASPDMSALNRVLEYTPEDMTVTVETGITLFSLQNHLAQRRQWLPIDPPNPATTTVGDILNTNLSGPHRFGFGTIRDHLIGLKAVLADGRVIKNGGKVVKNVAGYDLCKLFVGSQGSLGILVEATFKLRPLPEAKQFLAAPCQSLPQASALLGAMLESEITPVVLDLHNVADSPLAAGKTPPVQLVLGFAGTRAEVEWQTARAADLGVTQPTELGYEAAFWKPGRSSPHRISVLPSRAAELLQEMGEVEFVARAGNGVVYYRGGNPPARDEVPTALMRRIKETYDPKNIFRELPL